MSDNELIRIELAEYESIEFPGTEEIEDLLYDNYREYVELTSPSRKTNRKWILTAKGWVGRIPLKYDLEIVLKPKVAVDNVFSMLTNAYELEIDKDIKIPPGLIKCDSLGEFYELLVFYLSQKILERGRRGFYRAYKPKNEYLPYIRGRINIRCACSKPWIVNHECYYEEHIPDVKENQILIWTLQRILRSGLCTPDRSLPYVQRAYRALQGLVTPFPYLPETCVSWLYNRLDQDYKPMHALCRFFLENSGPSHQVGDHNMVPFLINMPNLYEQFVAGWLDANKSSLPPEFSIKALEKISFGEGRMIQYEIDLVLYKSGKAYCVLDTKYKIPDEIDNDDINQVVAYASAMDCQNAFLIYPETPDFLVKARYPRGNILLRTATFSLTGDLNQSGKEFLDELFSKLNDEKTQNLVLAV